ncbi:MAG: hypothetical protein IKD66_09125 [Solobacterium sp.]|nr:hypothetical protein [Solobacterium sp.]
MLKRMIGAAIAAGAAIGIAAAVKLILQKEEEEEESEVRFISLKDGEEADEEKKEEEKKEEYSEEVLEIAELYPYLDVKFIAEQFGRNEAFNEQYPEDSLITISHKAKFEDAQTMNSFVKIGEDNGYGSEILNETEVKITRKLFTEDGAILSDIFNVANQVSCLKGVYEGYNIEL